MLPLVTDDKFHDECGVFGIYGHAEAANLSYLGIHALQHRGQESAGIASWDGKTIHLHKAMGLVADIFNQRTIAGLPGTAAIGHTRYSTAGQSVIANAQPMVARTTAGQIAVAHNGNLVNAEELRRDLEKRGALFQGSSDTEVIVHLLAHQAQGSVDDRIRGALSSVRGAYSLLFLTEKGIVAVRDPLGFRPLVLGRLRNGATVFASETCALDLRGPTRRSSAGRCTRRARHWGTSSRVRLRATPRWSCPCPPPACRPRWGIPRRAASPMTWG